MVTIPLALPSQSPGTIQAEPVRIVDDCTERVYYLVPAEQFEKYQRQQTSEQLLSSRRPS